ncbi:MAG: tetratricopeptide repeat protein [Thermodesulfobacteriota bacterium]
MTGLRQWRKPATYLLLLIVGLLIYSNTLQSPFVLDDRFFILENPMIGELSNFLNFSGTRYVGFLSFALNYAVSGFDLFGFRLTNILIHIINSTLVYLFLTLTLQTPSLKDSAKELSALGAPLAAALLFLTHPVETQAVTYVVQRFTSLATLFYLASLCFYIKARLTGESGDGRGRVLFYAAALVTGLLAQKTKELAFTLPAVIVLYEFTFFKISNGLKKKIIYLVPFILLMAVIPISLFLPDLFESSTVASRSQYVKEHLTATASASRHDYLITQFRVIVTYLRLLILPVNQTFIYDYPLLKSFTEIRVLSSFALVAAFFFSAVYLYIRSIKRGKGALLLVTFLIIWFFMALSVESSIIPLRFVIFEHRLYLPSTAILPAATVAFFYLFMWFFRNKASITHRLYLWIFIIAVITIFSIATYQRNAVWKDKRTLWSDNLIKAPGSDIVHYDLALVYMDSGELEKSFYHLKRAVEINPANHMAFNNLANIFYIKRDYRTAMRYYIKALELEPKNGNAHYNLGLVYEKLGLWDKAQEEFFKALQADPTINEAREKLNRRR